MNEDLKNKVIKAFSEKKIPLKDLSKKLFMTDKQLKLLLVSWGVEFPKKERSKVPMPDRNTLMVMYNKQGTTQKVADFYGVSVNRVNRWMRSSNIPTKRMKLSDEEKIKLLEEHLKNVNNISF